MTNNQTPTPPKPTAILAHIAKHMDDVIGITPQQGADLLKLFSVNLEDLLESQSAPTNPEGVSPGYSIKLRAKAREEQIQAKLDLIIPKSMRLGSDNFARVSVQLCELRAAISNLKETAPTNPEAVADDLMQRLMVGSALGMQVAELQQRLSAAIDILEAHETDGAYTCACAIAALKGETNKTGKDTQ